MKRFHLMPFGAELTPAGCRFALWAPTAAEVGLILDGVEEPMPAVGNGWRELRRDAAAGARYAFRIGRDLIVPDPASRFQPDGIGHPSAVLDPAAYEWGDADWTGRPWEEAVIYELHVGTATPEGSFTELNSRLSTLAELGVTAIELMPLSQFPGRRNWGYDGVLPFAPAAAYGAPEDLKRLVDAAHRLGLMVLIDVVDNHFGQLGNYLRSYAASFFSKEHRTPWGEAINFDGSDSGPVREFFLHNALNWLEEFHCDGLRLDAVHAIHDESPTHFLRELAQRVRGAFPEREIHLILENDANEARYLARDTDGRPRVYSAQWNDDLHHAWHVMLTGETEGYYSDYHGDPVSCLGRALAEGFAYQGETSAHRGGASRGEVSRTLPPAAFVAFLQNHDQIGNRAMGERLGHLVARERVALARAVLLLAPQIPLLFMGEEWDASTLFLYFVDFEREPDLARAVREGRRKEFAGFAAFEDAAKRDEIPDPGDPATMARSVLNWRERRDHPHSAVLDETRKLLRLRQAEIVPLLAGAFRGASYAKGATDALEVAWRFGGGRLRLALNFDEAAYRCAIEPRERLLWGSPALVDERAVMALPPWSGALLKSEEG